MLGIKCTPNLSRDGDGDGDGDREWHRESKTDLLRLMDFQKSR